jgi:hypothetical protein
MVSFTSPSTAIEKVDNFWWGLMVLTTVDYGFTAPTTAIGKVDHIWQSLVVLTTVGYICTALQLRER